MASPYGRRIGKSDEECEHNVKIAIDAGRELIKRGHTPFIPHLYHYCHLGWSKTVEESAWLEICMVWIPFCNVILRLPGESVGADNEVALAKALGIKVYYSLDTLESNVSSDTPIPKWKKGERLIDING